MLMQIVPFNRAALVRIWRRFGAGYCVRWAMASSTRAPAGQLTARVDRPRGSSDLPAPGLTSLESGHRRGAHLLYVPPTYDARTPSPLAVMLHGAGATADQGIDLLRPYADDRRLVILAPKSASGTWDLITSSGFGRDAQALDALLDKEVFPKVAVDARHVAVGGFSDGASYALSLGITNGGHLFTHVLAFSPGFMCPSTQADHPSIFIAHGLSDAVLPITNCSQRLVPALREAGFPLTYVEFAGAHTVPSNVVEKALAWFLGEG